MTIYKLDDKLYDLNGLHLEMKRRHGACSITFDQEVCHVRSLNKKHSKDYARSFVEHGSAIISELHQ